MNITEGVPVLILWSQLMESVFMTSCLPRRETSNPTTLRFLGPDFWSAIRPCS